jgi:hypothetical protein
VLSITTQRKLRPGTSTPSRKASVPSRLARGSSRKMSTSVPVSIGSTCCAWSGRPFARQPVGDPAVNAAHPPDRGEQPQRAAARRDDQPRIGARQRLRCRRA